MTDTILIVDDEIDLLKGIQRSITEKLNSNILIATCGNEAIKIIKQNPIDLVLTDISMPGMDGLELLQSIMDYDSNITVIMMTAYGTIEIAVNALKQGAYDFVQKPFDFEYLIRLIRKGVEHNRLVRENCRLLKKVSEQAPLEKLVGNSKPMRMVHNQIKTLANSDVSVLILGETGSGKDLASQAIHELSQRRNRPFITVNCPALPEGLLESELFGYKKGAFTGADSNKMGLFDQADGGTIFLDEIGDLPMSLQTKLLRVLQNHEVKPLGSIQSHQVNTRVIAATNQDLNTKIEKGEFRADLYFRLHVTSLVMPALRDMKEDFPLLVKHFLSKAACELKLQTKSISCEVLNYLMNREWPGNTREFENLVRAWTATVSENEIQLKHVKQNSSPASQVTSNFDLGGSYKDLKGRVIKDFTLTYLTQLLTETKGNVSLSAKISGIKRQSLQKIISRYNIDITKYRTN